MNYESRALDPAFTFSQSSLQDYLDCPRRFELRYAQGLIWPAVEAEPVQLLENRQRDALLFHRLVQQHYLGLPRAALEKMSASPDLTRWWQNFNSAAPDLAGWTLFTEKPLACAIASRRLICKYDLLAIRDGKALIYDWKTFARRPKVEYLAARMQTRVYRSLLIQAGMELNRGQQFAPSDVSMIYWFAEFPGDPVTLEYDQAQYGRDLQVLEELVHEIEGASSFPLTPDVGHCRFCTYRSLCDRGTLPGVDPEHDEQSLNDGSTGDENEPNALMAS